MREWAIRVVILLAGLTIAHLGVTLFLLTELGTDPFNVFVQGLYRATAESAAFLTHGRVHIGVCLLLIVVIALVDRSYIRIGTVLCMICGGPIIDFFTMLLNPIGIQGWSLPVRIAVLAVGCGILACGMTIVIKSDAGTGPNDLVALIISDKLHGKFGLIRIITDVCFVLIGWALGGTVGLGTVICAFLVGPVAGLFLPVNGRLVERIVNRLSR